VSTQPFTTLKLLFLPVLLAVPISLLFFPVFANAQDTEEIVGYEILGEDLAGRYAIQVQVSPGSPIVGTTRFAVRIRDSDTGDDIDDAIVRIFGTPAEKGEKQYSPALNSPFDPVFYLAQLDFEHAGLWAIDVEIETELGAAVTVMSLQVVPRARSGTGNRWGTSLFSLVSLALVAGVTWLWYSSKRTRERNT
jgi:hypothetical protein